MSGIFGFFYFSNFFFWLHCYQLILAFGRSFINMLSLNRVILPSVVAILRTFFYIMIMRLTENCRFNLILRRTFWTFLFIFHMWTRRWSLYRCAVNLLNHTDQFVLQPMEFGWQIVLGSFVGFIGAAFGSIGGVGGGGFFVPMLTLIIGFDAKSSVAISKCEVLVLNLNQLPAFFISCMDYLKAAPPYCPSVSQSAVLRKQ